MDDSSHSSNIPVVNDWDSQRHAAIRSLSTSAVMAEEDEVVMVSSPHVVDQSSMHHPEEEEDDNWSRQVETDEIMVRAPSSVLEEEQEASAPIPLREEPTLKEKLVERERQRRVETERARLKRQFALRESVAEEAEEEGDHNNYSYQAAADESVAGTVGEGSIVAPVEVLVAEEEQQGNMTYPMERFLQEQGTILEEEQHANNMTRDHHHGGRDTQPNQGVVMERFLQEPVVVEPANEDDINDERGHTTSSSIVEQSVSFEMDSPGSPTPHHCPSSTVTVPLTSTESVPEDLTRTPARAASSAYGVNMSTEVHTPGEGDGTSVDGVPSEDDDHSTRMANLVSGEDPPTPSLDEDRISISGEPESPSLDQPRVLGLTQAEIEELAAIEEVSQQNAPPSERDDLSASSFVAELVNDFGPGGGSMMEHHHHHHQPGASTTSLSQGTPTTAMESASVQSIRASETHTEDHQSSMDDEAGSNLMDDGCSDAGGSASVEANPPSEHGDTLLSPIPTNIEDNHMAMNNTPGAGESSMISDDAAANLWATLQSREDEGGSSRNDLSEQLKALNAGVVNRQIRPGMISQRVRPTQEQRVVRRTTSAPANMNITVDGFDFDKDAPATPTRNAYANMANELSASDMWSPGSRISESPSSPNRPIARNIQPAPILRNSLTEGQRSNTLIDGQVPTTAPLIPGIPTEIVGSYGKNGESKEMSATNMVLEEEDSRDYLHQSSFNRAFPSRTLALGLTILLEIPVLLASFANADALWSVLGLAKYQLFMSLLPVCCAISGNAGLQSKDVMSRGLATGHISNERYLEWMPRELGTTAILGVLSGAAVGLLSFFLSKFDIVFAVAMFLSQTMSVAFAGICGSGLPLLLKSVAGRNKWSGILVTICQDILSTLVTVFIMLKVMTISGSSPSAMDTCGV